MFINYLIENLIENHKGNIYEKLENGEQIAKGKLKEMIKEKLEYSESSEVETFDLLTEIKEEVQIMGENSIHAGHRERLKQRFADGGD